MAIIESDAQPQTPFERAVADTQRYFDSPRFDGITRLYSARQVVEQRGTIPSDYIVAREAADAFYPRLRELFAQRKSITTFGPYSPGQAVVMKRMGIEGIYLGGWATSAKGSISEDPGPDLASYPLSQVPEEAAGLVRALLTADRNQHYLRLQMTDEPSYSFLVVEPCRVIEDYKPDLADEDVEFLGLNNPEDALLFNIATLHADGSVTANLKGPIVINRYTLVGKQVIPRNVSDYSLQHALATTTVETN